MKTLNELNEAALAAHQRRDLTGYYNLTGQAAVLQSEQIESGALRREDSIWWDGDNAAALRLHSRLGPDDEIPQEDGPQSEGTG